MTLAVKDGAGLVTAVKSTFAAGAHTPHHNVDSLPGTMVADIAATKAAAEATNTKLDTLNAAITALQALVDGLETLIGSTNTALTTLSGHVDGLEGFTDGVETLIGATNTALGTLGGYLDGVEGKLDTLHADLLPASAGTQSNVVADVTSKTVLAANSGRKRALVYNDSDAVLYLLLAAGTASSTTFSLPLQPAGYIVVEGYSGIIVGIWTAASGHARVTEWT